MYEHASKYMSPQPIACKHLVWKQTEVALQSSNQFCVWYTSAGQWAVRGHVVWLGVCYKTNLAMQEFPAVISMLHHLFLFSSLSLTPTSSRATQPDASHFTTAGALPSSTLTIFSPPGSSHGPLSLLPGHIRSMQKVSKVSLDVLLI